MFAKTHRGLTNFDVTDDGQRFLYPQPAGLVDAASAGTSAAPTLRVVLGWFEELRDRVPAGR